MVGPGARVSCWSQLVVQLTLAEVERILATRSPNCRCLPRGPCTINVAICPSESHAVSPSKRTSTRVRPVLVLVEQELGSQGGRGWASLGPHATPVDLGMKPRRPWSFPVKSTMFTSLIASSAGSCLLFSMMMTCASVKDAFTLFQKCFLIS